MLTALWTRGRLTALRTVLACALALCTGAGLAQAGGTPGPAIDGNGDDLIAFAAGLSGRDCGLDFDDPRDDISIADPKIIVCAPKEDTDGNAVADYFVNGFDMRKFVFAYDRANSTLYLLWRTEGIVGDTDGNLDPDNNNCLPANPTFADEPGIGSQENYQVRLDTNCDGAPDIIIGVGGVLGTDQVTVQGASISGSSLAYRAGGSANGKDLEVRITGLTLPAVYRVRGNANASFDGLGEDITSEQGCTPNPSILLDKAASVPVICPGGTVDFRLVVTNNGDVDLADVTVVDQLPAGLVYQSTESNTCGGGVNAVGNTITYGPFSLAAGASFEIILRVGRTAECAGEQVNNAVVTGSFQSPCFNNGQAFPVTDDATASVLCGNVICEISAPDTRVCPGETVEICGPAGDFSYAWSTGATTRCITVGAGTYSLVVTDNASGCVSTNPCSVTITEDPRPICSISAPDTRVCPGETVEICGPEGNFSYAWSTGATTRCITVGAGTYSLVITDLKTGCVSNNSCSVTITEDPRPLCSISAPDTRVCPGETVEICGPEGNFSYAWSTGATTRCITVGAGTYSLVITDLATGCVSNNSCSVTIAEDPRPLCSISAPDTDVCPGETVEICGPEGNFSYAWSTGATTRCITVGAGTYSLVITDLATGCVSNNSCSVTIVEAPRPLCSISAPDTRVCPGETVEICGPEGNYTYAWSTGATTRCITVGAGTYSLVITTSGGCVSDNSCSVTITEDPRPVCSLSAPDTRVCGNETVEICGPEGNYSYAWSTGATTRCITVGAGTYSLVITDQTTGCVSDNTCSVTVEQDTPLISVTKGVSPAGPVEQGTLLTYEITVTNPPNSTITAQSITVTDELCDEVLYANNANIAPDSAPNVGETGTIVWTIGPLAPGASTTITFDARVRELPNPECESTNRSCENVVTVSTACGGGTPATDTDSVTTPILPCLQPGLCRLTGGGCLNEDGGNRGHKQSTFGGNSSPYHEGGGPTGNSWEHVYRDGNEVLFNWHSWDAYVTQCTVVEPGPCHPSAVNTKADFQGTGLYSIGAGGREEDGNMVAYIIDHREGSCNRGDRDEYSIIVRTGLVIGEGDIVFQTSGEIDCGNLQIHETPPHLFGGGTQQPGDHSEIQSVALLNRAVPNPFTGSMSYAYEIVGGDQPVEIGVYNVAGRLVKTLVQSTLPAGRHTATWNGTDEGGARVPSGVYFVRARYGAELQQQRVIYLGR